MLAETEELAEVIARHMNGRNGALAVRPGVIFARMDAAPPRFPVLCRAAIGVLAQGRKRLRLGERAYTYDESRYLVSTMMVPAVSEVARLEPGKPLLALTLDFDWPCIGRLIVQMAEGAPDDRTSKIPFAARRDALCPAAVDRPIARALLRLGELACSDRAWRILGSDAMREVFYWVLRGPAGAFLRDRVTRSGSLEPVARAVRFIESRLHERLDIPSIARAAAVSPSGLHAHFKDVTAQSPMQFVKRLRLEHAMALLFSGRAVTTAAFEVGYASASQFSRDFRRHYGVPPSKLQDEISAQLACP